MWQNDCVNDVLAKMRSQQGVDKDVHACDAIEDPSMTCAELAAKYPDDFHSEEQARGHLKHVLERLGMFLMVRART